MFHYQPICWQFINCLHFVEKRQSRSQGQSHREESLLYDSAKGEGRRCLMHESESNATLEVRRSAPADCRQG